MKYTITIKGRHRNQSEYAKQDQSNKLTTKKIENNKIPSVKQIIPIL